MFLGYTIENVEDIAANEVDGKVIAKKRIIFKKTKKEYFCLNRVMEISVEGNCEDLKSIEELCKKFKEKCKESISVDCIREGDHGFKSVDIQKIAAGVFAKKGYTIDFKNPCKVIGMDVFNNQVKIGFIIADKLCRREYRIKINNQSVNGCLAAICALAAGVGKKDVVVDPLCKDGVIAIEIAKQGAKKVYAFDPLKNNTRNAKVNIQVAKVEVNARTKDISWLETEFKKNEITKVVTNAFIGKYDKTTEGNIKELFRQAESVVKESVTILTNDPQGIKNCAENFTINKEWNVIVGDMTYGLIIFKKKS